MAKGPYWGVNGCSAGQKFLDLGNLKVHYQVYKNLPLDAILSQRICPKS